MIFGCDHNPILAHVLHGVNRGPTAGELAQKRVARHVLDNDVTVVSALPRD